MFVLAQSATYEWPVKFVMPAPTGGNMVECAFVGIFKRLARHEVKALTEKSKAENWDDARLAIDLIVGWQEVSDAAGHPKTFDAESLAEALQTSGVGTAICVAFFSSQGRAAEKNS